MSNHFSAANLKSPGDDARLDLTELFVFAAPDDPDRTVLIMDANPFTNGDGFHPDAVYRFNIDNDGDALADVATATGGASAIADDPSGVGALFEDVQQTLRKQYVTTFVSQLKDTGAVPLTLTVGSASDTKEFVPGSNQAGAASLEPRA